MSRPVDWTPLADSDPVPGNPDEIDRLAKHYKDTSTEISRQASNLRKMAKAEGWDADSGRAFADQAGELAGTLEKADGRYQETSAALRSWSPELEHAQKLSLQARDQAQDAQRKIDANSESLIEPGNNDPSDELKELEKDRQSAYGNAEGELEAARILLGKATDHRDEHSRDTADKIRKAADDELTDNWWNDFMGWVREHADIIKLIQKIASWVGTIAGILSIFLGWVPILGQILIVTAIVGTGISLICNTMLALSGEGDWLSVGLDILGLVTFGYGKVAAKGLKAGAQTTKTAAGRAAAKRGSRSMRQTQRTPIDDLTRRLNAKTTPKATRKAIRKKLDVLQRQARNSGFANRRALNRELADVKPSVEKSIMYGDKEIAKLVQQVKVVGRQFPESDNIAKNAAQVEKYARRIATSFISGTSTDLLDKGKVFDPVKPYFTYEKFTNDK